MGKLLRARVRFIIVFFIAVWPVPAGHAAVLTVPTGSDALVNGDNFQAAVNNARCGDTIVLQAGASYQTRITFINSYGPQGSPFSLPNKSCSSGQYVTIQTSALSSLPSGRISPANVGQMAQLATNTNSWVIEPASRAGNYQFIGIEFTNTASLTTNNGNTAAIVFATGQNPAYGAWGHDMVFDRVWIHPYDDVTNPSGTTRTAQWGIILDGANQTIKNSYISGICCFASNAGPAGGVQQSVAILIGSGPGPVTITNNFIEAYAWNIFTGGSSGAQAGSVLVNPANTATISRATLTQATFSRTATLLVGDYVAFVVPVWTTPSSFGGNPSSAYVVVVDAIDTGTGVVTYHGVGADAIANGPSLPADGTRAQWRGSHLVGVTVTGNTLSKRAAWCSGLYTPPKSVWEMKDGSNVLFEGNIVDIPSTYAGNPGGCAPTNTAFTANQDGTTPWMATNNNVFRSNLFRGLGRIVHAQPYPNHTLVPASCGFTITNNLFDGTARPSFMETEGGCSWTVTHNTVRGMTNSIFQDISEGRLPTPNVLFRDNIVTSGNYFFNQNSSYPGKVEDHNVVINKSGAAAPSYMSSDFVVTGDGAVGFVNVTGADAGADYHGYALASTSPFRGRASDGTDPGVNFVTLDAALGGSSSLTAPTNLTVR